jgi:V/A-type H+-transporting ATPase subunit E
MMSIEKITEKILSEANEDAQRAIEKAESDKTTVLQDAQNRVQEIIKDAEERSKADAELVKSRKISSAELEGRKMRLAAKQDAISKCFEKAKDTLAEMPEDDYIKLMVKLIHDTGMTQGELLLNQKDHKSVGSKIVKQVNSAGKFEKLELSKEKINAKGGFVLRNGAIEINTTLDTMVNAVKESVTPEVVEALFQ